MEDHKLPFEVGQFAEATSYEKGFRAAWFRCRIHEIDSRKGYIRHELEFIDFPDEKKKWTRIYQVPYHTKKRKRQLMVRPQYPHRCNEIQMPAINMISAATYSVDDLWMVGDLVDWWTDGCYWRGTVTQLLGNGKAKITLLEPPEGEGGSYEIHCKDLRPSLDWSPEDGWRFPTLKESDNCTSFGRLIQQLKQGVNNTNKPGDLLLTSDIRSMDEASKDVENKVGSPFNASLCSHNSENSIPASAKSDPKKTAETHQHLSISIPEDATETPEGNDLAMKDSSIGKASLSDGFSSPLKKKYSSAETAVHTDCEGLQNSAGSIKKLKTGATLPLNIMFSDSLDASLLDFEELANKIQWLKNVLDYKVPLTSDVRPPWKFVEHFASSTEK